MRPDTIQDMVRHCQLGKAPWLMHCALWVLSIRFCSHPTAWCPQISCRFQAARGIEYCKSKYKRSTFPKVARVHGHSQELTQPGFKQLCLDLLCPKMISISGFCIHSLGFSHKNIWVLGSPQRLQVTSSAATSPTIERLVQTLECFESLNMGLLSNRRLFHLEARTRRLG